MPRAIILTKEWTMSSSGVTKPDGTRIVFSNRSEEADEILKQDKGELEMDLPPDLPARKHFQKAGFKSLQSLKVLESWQQVPGIGPKTAKELDEYFQPKTKGE